LNTPQFFIRPIKLYFVIFLTIGFSLLLFIDLTLFKEGENIRETVKNQSQVEAYQELDKTISNAIKNIQKQARAISEWDEVHQQFHDPSYYFFWHDERLKESGYYKSYYDSLELYKADKTLLMPASPNKRLHFFLPDKITHSQPTFVFNNNQETHLTIFHSVKARGSEDVIGYIGISVDFLPLLLNQQNFYNVDKSSIVLSGNGIVSASEIMESIEFKAQSNPVSEYLWQLIQGFIIELIIIMIIITLLIIVIFNQTIYTPLQVISDYLQRLKNSPHKPQPIPKETFFLKEFEELKQSIHHYHKDLQKTQQELDKQNQTVWEQARRDSLTNIHNRRAFDEEWAEIIKSKDMMPTAFMLFDCDFFKALNDTYGHEIGDEVIKISASTIQQSLPIDCPVYRIGGDEFAVILLNRSPEETISIANQCLAALKKTSFNQLGIKEQLTFSVGVSSTHQDLNNEIQNLPRQADIAMYKAKQSLQNKVQCYHQRLDNESQSLVSNQIVNTVVEAIHSGLGIQMHFQPIQDLKTKEVYYESLIRLNQEGSIIYPNDIFSIVDRRRLEVELDHQVVQQIFKSLKTGQIPKGTGISVNVSGKTLLQSSFLELFNPISQFLGDYKIVIEVTENSLIDHMDYAKNILNTLRDNGFLIALDDFGSGYSSIRYLAHMPVDIIKFDMSMTHALMQEDIKTVNIIKSTAEMILNSGYDLVMEGVETEEMLRLAEASGATHIQGYLIGKPSPEPKRFDV